MGPAVSRRQDDGDHSAMGLSLPSRRRESGVGAYCACARRYRSDASSVRSAAGSVSPKVS
jgi:hypothetical protein